MSYPKLLLVLTVAAVVTLSPETPGLEKIQHTIVICAENRSFDHLYGLFPGANGIAKATAEQTTQVDRGGEPLGVLPPVMFCHPPGCRGRRCILWASVR
jgi:phospholipase C